MDIVVARMAGHGTPAHQIRLPPMNVSETFDSLLGDLVVDPVLGLVSPSWRARGDLEVPLGITDVPWSSAVSSTASTCRGPAGTSPSSAVRSAGSRRRCAPWSWGWR